METYFIIKFHNNLCLGSCEKQAILQPLAKEHNKKEKEIMPLD